MPTRWWLPSSGTAAVSPTISAEWEHSSAVRRPMAQVQGATALTSTAYTPDAADHLVNGDALHVQFVSEPLAAQTIAAQTVSISVKGLMANASNAQFLTWKLFVWTAAGAVGSTLLAIRRDATAYTASLINRTDSATTTGVTVGDGDRLVLEIGTGGTPVAAGGVQGHNATLRWGESGATDAPANDTSTSTTENPWLEFANVITPFTPPEIPKAGADTATTAEGVGISGTATSTDSAAAADALALSALWLGADSAIAADALTITPNAGTDAATVLTDDPGWTTDGAQIAPPETLIAGADTGTGGDAVSVAQIRAISAADTGTGSEAALVPATLAAAESATAADALSLLRRYTGAETGSAADALAVTATMTIAESGVVVDNPGASSDQGATTSESGTVVDAATVAVTLTQAETGLAVDASLVGQTRSLAETATATDALTAARQSTLADTATAADAVQTASLVTRAETGAATDALTLQRQSTLAEAGAVSDALLLAGQTASAETATGTDAVLLTTARTIAETGAATDAVSAAFSLQAAETGTASDSVRVDLALEVAETAVAVDSVTVGVLRLETAVYVAFGLSGAQVEYVPQTPTDADPQYVTPGVRPSHPDYVEHIERTPRVRYTGADERPQRAYQHRLVQR